MLEPTPSAPILDRDALIEQHRSYVRALAIKVMQSIPVPVDLDELIGYGSIGLVEAAERYDPRRGVSFSTFSHYRIKGAIYDGLREMGYTSRAGGTRVRWAANANDIIQAAADDEQVTAENAGSSVDDEIATTQSLIDALIPVYFLSLTDESVPEIVDQNALSMEKIEQREMIGFVLKMVSELTEDEQQLIHSLYFKHVSMTELATRLGVTKSWISRLHSRAIQHLRDRLQEQGVLDAA